MIYAHLLDSVINAPQVFTLVKSNLMVIHSPRVYRVIQSTMNFVLSVTKMSVFNVQLEKHLLEVYVMIVLDCLRVATLVMKMVRLLVKRATF